MMKKLRKLKYAKNEVRNLRRSPDTSLKDRKNTRVLVQRAKTLDSQGARKQRTNSQRGYSSLSKENRCQCLVKHGNREQFQLWYCNVDTLKRKKFKEVKALLGRAVNLPQSSLLNETNSKISAVTWSPVWRKLQSYNKKNKNNSPDGRRRAMLLCIRKDLG